MNVIAVSRRLLRIVGRIEMVAAAIILVGIVVTILVQVALNAGLGNPIAWEQEGGAYALVWLTFLGASIALKQSRHVTIISFVSSMPPRPQALLRMIGLAIVIWLFVTLLRELTGVIPIEGRATTVALPIDLPRSWFFSVPLFLTSALMLWTALHQFAEQGMRLFSGDPNGPSPIEPAREQTGDVS